MAAHTPLPWRMISRDRNLRHGRGPGYDIQEDCPDGLGEFICDKVTQADAEFILRAVHNYDRLLVACKLALSHLHWVTTHGHNCDEAVAAVKAAIAAAEECPR